MFQREAAVDKKKCINKVKGNFEPGCLRGQGRKKTKRAPAVRGGAACRKSRFICSDIVTNSGEDFILSLYLCLYYVDHVLSTGKHGSTSLVSTSEHKGPFRIQMKVREEKKKSVKEEFAYS